MRTLSDLVPLRRPECIAAADTVSALATGEDDAGLAGDEHVAGCLRCQVEVLAFRRVVQSLHLMRGEQVDIPKDGPEAAIAMLHAQIAVGRWQSRAAYVGGLTAAGVLVWMSRRRPALLPLG